MKYKYQQVLIAGASYIEITNDNSIDTMIFKSPENTKEK
jgi:hypothetical protein